MNKERSLMWLHQTGSCGRRSSLASLTYGGGFVAAQRKRSSSSATPWIFFRRIIGNSLFAVFRPASPYLVHEHRLRSPDCSGCSGVSDPALVVGNGEPGEVVELEQAGVIVPELDAKRSLSVCCRATTKVFPNNASIAADFSLDRSCYRRVPSDLRDLLRLRRVSCVI